MRVDLKVRLEPGRTDSPDTIDRSRQSDSSRAHDRARGSSARCDRRAGVGSTWQSRLRVGIFIAGRLRAGPGRPIGAVRRRAERHDPRGSQRRAAARRVPRSHARGGGGRRARIAGTGVCARRSERPLLRELHQSGRGHRGRPIPAIGGSADRGRRFAVRSPLERYGRGGVHRAAVREPQRRATSRSVPTAFSTSASAMAVPATIPRIVRRIRPSCSGRCCEST